MIFVDERIAKSRSDSAQISVISMELFIIETLLNGRSVVIPDFGHLELKSLGDRRTVFFKSTNGSDSLLRIMSAVGEEEKRDASILNKLISIPLKEGKIVNLPQIGIFRPFKREDGKFHISFIPSSSLRKLLNEEDAVNVRKEIKKEADAVPNMPEQKDEPLNNKLVTNKISDVMGDSRKLKTTKSLTNNGGSSRNSNNVNIRNASSSIFLKKNSHLNDIIVPPKKESKFRSKILWIILAIIAFTAIVVVAVTAYIYYNNINNDNNNKTVAPQVSLVAPAVPATETAPTSTAPAPGSTTAPNASATPATTEPAVPNATATPTSTTAVPNATNAATTPPAPASTPVSQAAIVPTAGASAVAPTGTTIASVKEASDLPSLAKQYYGHPAFWIYIYEANQDKLNSPINIPKNVSLTIPDLKAVYGVDVNDNMEVQRAKIRADLLLREKMSITNNK